MVSGLRRRIYEKEFEEELFQKSVKKLIKFSNFTSFTEIICFGLRFSLILSISASSRGSWKGKPKIRDWGNS